MEDQTKDDLPHSDRDGASSQATGADESLGKAYDGEEENKSEMGNNVEQKDESETKEKCRPSLEEDQKKEATGETTKAKEKESITSEGGAKHSDANEIMVQVSLDTIQSQLVCQLCQGHFREPYTITKCLHTFCRSCLYFFAISRQQFTCPTCDVYIGQDVRKLALPDRTLQNLMDKILFPGLAADDAQIEANFYRQRGIKRKPPTEQRLRKHEMEDDDEDEKNGEEEEEEEEEEESVETWDTISRMISQQSQRRRTSTSAHGHDTNRPPVEHIIFRLIPGTPLDCGPIPPPPLELPFLRTNTTMTVGTLKQYIYNQVVSTQADRANREKSVGEAAAAELLRTMADPQRGLMIVVRDLSREDTSSTADDIDDIDDDDATTSNVHVCANEQTLAQVRAMASRRHFVGQGPLLYHPSKSSLVLLYGFASLATSAAATTTTAAAAVVVPPPPSPLAALATRTRSCPTAIVGPTPASGLERAQDANGATRTA